MPSLRRSTKKQRNHKVDDISEDGQTTTSSSSLGRIGQSITSPFRFSPKSGHKTKNKSEGRAQSTIVTKKEAQLRNDEHETPTVTTMRRSVEPGTKLAVLAPTSPRQYRKPIDTFSDSQEDSSVEDDKIDNLAEKNECEQDNNDSDVPTSTDAKPDEKKEDKEETDDTVETSASRVLSFVLLLMDPTTRRFELVQLEFDAKRGTVQDVLDQIPASANEGIFKDIKYIGICKRDGSEMEVSHLIADYCSGNDIVIAVPEGSEKKEMSKQAALILSNQKVIDMLRPTGIIISAIDGKYDTTSPEGTTDEKDDTTAPEGTTDEKDDTTAPEGTTDEKDDTTASEGTKKDEDGAPSKKSTEEAIPEAGPELDVYKKDENTVVVERSLTPILQQTQQTPRDNTVFLIVYLFLSLSILLWGLMTQGGTTMLDGENPISEQPTEMELPEVILLPEKKNILQHIRSSVGSILKFRAKGQESI